MSGAIVVFGAAGQVGTEVLVLPAQRGMAIVGFGRSEADIGRATGVKGTSGRMTAPMVAAGGRP